MKLALPMLAMILAAPTATLAQDASYPPCSATVHDHCAETGGHAGKAHKGKHKHAAHKKHAMKKADKAKDATAPAAK